MTPIHARIRIPLPPAGPGAPPSCSAPRIRHALRAALALLWCGAVLGPTAGTARAQAVSNSAAGTSAGAALDPTRAAVSLNRVQLPGVSSVAEIAPNRVLAASTGNVFTVDVLPTINPTDPVVSQIAVTLPPGYAPAAVLSVAVGGIAQAAACPNPAAGEYCANVAGQVVTVTLGQAVTASLTNLRIRFSADAPVSEGTADFGVAIVSAGGPRASIAGDANGDPLDANSLTVAVRASVDSTRSTVTALPPVVRANGAAVSTITTTLLDIGGRPVTGRVIALSSDRGANDVFTQPASPTDANGVAIGTVRSNVAGIAHVTARDVTDSLSLAMRPQVAFSESLVLRLNKSADRPEAVIGDVVTYTVVLRNLTAQPVSGVRVQDQLPPDFKVLRGSSTLNARPIPDPGGVRPIVFDVGTVPAFADQNGNGEADPGEPGYLALRYQLVVGSGATPGEYRNTAVAIDVCDVCTLSNPDEARVRVRVDEVFSLGTIIGRVFEDGNRDGRQDRGEAGVAGAMVALDDGSYVLTDENGLYHFVAVRPGDRLVKISTQSLPGKAEMTTDESRIVAVTPGLLAKANFGVVIQRDTLKTGSPPIPGLEIAGAATKEPVEVVGTVEGPKLLLNGSPLALPGGDVRLSMAGLTESIEISGRSLDKPLGFKLEVAAPHEVRGWTLTLIGPQGRTERVLHGDGLPPPEITWDGVKDDGTRLNGGEVYQYQAAVDYGDGSRVMSAVRAFGVNRATAISLSMTGKAFPSGQDALNASARQALTRVAAAIRRFPDEKILIEGHTDSVGTHETNMDFSRRRAEAAAAYLVNVEKIPQSQLVLRWYGADRPLVSNQTPEGRELNRRVDIKSQFREVEEARILDQYRAPPAVRINGEGVDVDPRGRFATRVDSAAAGLLEIEIKDARGRLVQKAVPLPRIEILHPSGTVRVPYGTAQSGLRALPRPTAEISSQVQFASGEAASVDRVVAVCSLVGRTDPGGAVQLDQKELAVDSAGAFAADLDLRLGYNTFGLLVKNAAGGFIKADLASVTAAAAGTAASMPDDFRVSITDAPGKTAYPISSFTWLLVPAKIEDASKRKVITDFLKWMVADGQKFTEALSYAPLPKSVVAKEMKAISLIQ